MYRAGVYCRLSIEEANDGHSQSIVSQIEMAEAYIREQSGVVRCDTYIDDGVSGKDFQRPEFQRMITDIEHGNINMVIIKDFSRLGRERIDTSYYLEKYFPEHQVRVISLLDQYDSAVSLYDEMMDIKILLNDMYLQDTSKKIKAAIRAKRNSGEYACPQIPFGYRKSDTIRNHLEIDPVAAGVVKRIFTMYLDGNGLRSIATVLNHEEIPSPAKYKKEILKLSYPWDVGKGLWTIHTIRDILRNPVYTGAIVVSKTEKPSAKIPYRREIPLEKRELIRGTHEPIVSQKDYDAVQALRKDRRVTCLSNRMEEHKYAGVLVCGCCGMAMRKRYLASKGCFDGYICGFHQRMGKQYCQFNFISFERLDQLVLSAINTQIKALRDSVRDLEKNLPSGHSDTERKRLDLKKKMDKNQEYQRHLYEQYVEDTLSKADYMELKELYSEEMKKMQKEYDALENEQNEEAGSLNELKQLIKKFRSGKLTEKQLTRDLITELIESIRVYPNQEIEICFRFKDPKEGEA